MASTNKSFQDKLLPLMTVALIGAAFMLGNLWGKVQIYENGTSAKAAVAGTNNNGTGTGDTAAAPTEDSGPLSSDLWNEVLDNAVYAYGDDNAPVTMVEFTDYQCPFCKRHFDETNGQIVSDFINTGKVRYVFRDLPLSFHPNARPAANAARCAGDQAKYLEMHDMLFSKQDEWVNQSDPGATFKSFASNLGLNAGTFASCYDNQSHDDAIGADLTLASKVGATGTPTFFINGTKVVGAQPYSAFQAAIDAAL